MEEDRVGNERPYTRGASTASRRPPGTGFREETSDIDLALQLRRAGPWTVVAVEGELDLYTAPQLRDAVLAAVADGADHVVLDLTGVPFMDSSGLGVVVACLKRLREGGGDLAVVTPPGSPPTKLLSLTGLDRAIATHATVDEATA
jgi:anti-sigma B factor antagonist